MSLPRIFSPSVHIRLFDPMPLPRKAAAARRARIAILKLNSSISGDTADKSKKPVSRRFTYKISKIPMNA